MLTEGGRLPSARYPQAELAGAGDGLAEEFPGPLNITELAAGEEHPGTQRRPVVIGHASSGSLGPRRRGGVSGAASIPEPYKPPTNQRFRILGQGGVARCLGEPPGKGPQHLALDLRVLVEHGVEVPVC